MDCSLPISSVYGISQAKTPEWVAISFSGASSRPRDPTCISCTVDSLLVATWESHQWCKQRLNSFPNLPSAISIVLIPMITDGHQSQLGFPFLHPARKMGSLCLCIFSLYKNHSFSFQASWGHMPSPRPIRDCFVLT